MKAVLISVQPKWVEKILSGEKTIEVRKSAPKLERPFKCYIYCTEGKDILGFHNEGEKLVYTTRKRIHKTIIPEYFNKHIVAEFTCVGIMKPSSSLKLMSKESCVPVDDLLKYSNGRGLYGWRISGLKIYDKPKELSEFKRTIYLDSCCKILLCTQQLTRPPQSYCYVEEE